MKQLLTALLGVTILMLACKKEKKSLASITTTAATNVTSNSVATGGNITDDGNSGITKRGIAWADHASPTVGDSITNDGTGAGSFTSNITGLNANTTYYFKAYATNASGTAYGNEVSVKTAAGVPTVTTTAVSDLQPLSAKSGGNITNDGGSAITERGIVYATTSNPTTSNFIITAGTGTGTFTVSMSPLASQQTYYVRAYATNSYGTIYGNQVQFNAASANTVSDIDGNVYTYVTLCGKNWTTSNLKTTKYINGDPITNGLTGYDWGGSTTGAYTFPNGETSRKDAFGLLYNIYAINDSRGVCPAGWHVPSDDEWKTLEVCQGMTMADADQVGFRGTIGDKLLEGGTSGLNLQKAGYVNTTGNYLKFNEYAMFLTSTVVGTNGEGNWLRALNVSGTGPIYRTYNSGWTASARCVKD